MCDIQNEFYTSQDINRKKKTNIHFFMKRNLFLCLKVEKKVKALAKNTMQIKR